MRLCPSAQYIHVPIRLDHWSRRNSHTLGYLVSRFILSHTRHLTRFIGMWGTLPHITNERQPITFSSARLKCLDLSTMEHLLLGQSCGKSPVTPLVALACATQDLDLAKSLVLTSCSSEGPLTMLTRPDPFKKGISRRVT